MPIKTSLAVRDQLPARRQAPVQGPELRASTWRGPARDRANGAGKTGLLRLIAGLLPLNAGSVEAEMRPSLPELCHYVGT
jgi:hypothetical protein